jgi:hypothetical protein
MVARKGFPSVSSGQLQNIGRYSTTAPASLHYALSGRSTADFRVYCRQVIWPAPCFAVKGAGGDFSSRTSIREARCTCPPLHVMITFGGSCSKSNAFPPAGCRNPCIFTSPGLDTKFALSGPQMPLLTGWVEVDDQTLTTLRRMFRPHRSALVNGQGSLHDKTWGRSTYTVSLLASAPAELCMVMAGV